MNVNDIQKRIMALYEPHEAGVVAGPGAPAAGDPALGQVVVWYDPEGEFYEAVEQLELPGVEVFREEPNRLFELKRALNQPLAGRSILLYRRRPEGDLRDNWLADVEVLATPFKADYLSMLMSDIGAADCAKLREAVGACRAWLGKKTNARRVRELGGSGFTEPAELYLAVMACVLGRDVPADRAEVLAAYLAAEYACEEEAAQAGEAGEGTGADAAGQEPSATEADLRAAGVWEQLRGLLAACTGCDDEGLSCADARKRVLLGALADGVAPLGLPQLAALERLVPPERAQHRCREVVRAWKRRDAVGLTGAARQAEADLRLSELVDEMPLEALAACDALPCVDDSIIRRLLAQACRPTCDVDAALDVVAQRKPLAWNGRLAPYYDALEALLLMRRFKADNAAGFFRASAAEVWGGYTDGWWRMDSLYRRLQRSAGAAYEDSVDALDDALRDAAEYAEGLYKGWYIKNLSAAWEQAAQDDLAAQGYCTGVDRQDLFYMNEVAPLAKKDRVFVVVSDALRYEVACELADALEAATQGKAELASVQAVFPSVTACGMAALLPHAGLSMACEGEAGVKVLVDGQPSASTAERQALLARKSEGAVAVRYKELIDMRREERRELVAGARVVYVYHDAIDAIGDSRKTEREVFDACTDAIDQLTGLVRMICGELRCANVVITADHGFVYTHDPLESAEKVSLAQLEGTARASGRRYVLAQAGAACDAMAQVSMRPFSADLVGFSPRGCLRIAKPGEGENYVHGGISLQELCVPVLRFRNLRSNSHGFEAAAPSPLELITTATTVTSNAFAREFLQKEPVGGKVLAAAYEVRLVDAAGTPVTDTVPVKADRTGAQVADRRLRATLTMRPGVPTSASREYRLQVRNAQTGELVIDVPHRVDIAFAQEDFGW